jgi:hypothetical protein
MLSIVDEAATCSQISSGKLDISMCIRCSYPVTRANSTTKECDVLIRQQR